MEFRLPWRGLVGAGLLAWAVLVLANFVLREPPFYLALGRGCAALLDGRILLWPGWTLCARVAESIAFLALASVPGYVLLRRRLPELSPLASSAAAIALGWGLWMLSAEVFAIFHLLYRWSLVAGWALTLAICALVPKAAPLALEPEPRWRSQPLWEKTAWCLALALVILITGLTFYHALVFPVTYWDSLILYVDYGEQTYLAHGFPTLVCLQVGLGLGANYPHLYPLTAASMGTLWGHWQDAHAQFLSPFAGLLACFLVYSMAKRISGSRLVGMLAVLAFRSVPYATFYFIFASDYSIAMLLTALFLWGMEIYIRSGRAGGLETAALAVAIAMHLNYLMGILWLPLLFAPWLRAWQAGEPIAWKTLLPRKALVVFAIAAALGSVWYIRNIIVTGNPVYAFFPSIFGGKNINLEVLESCFQEWRRHGDGIGRYGTTLGEKLAGLPQFLLFDRNYHWKYGPILTAFALPGILFTLRANRRILLGALMVFLSVWAYHFVLGDLYLYHTLMMLPAAVLLGANLWSEFRPIWFRAGFALWLLAAGGVCGLGPALVGGKWMGFGPLALELPSVVRTDLRLAGKKGTGDEWMPVLRERFLLLTLGDAYRMWQYMNAHVAPARVLTHENRHHYLSREIELIGLDDCGLTPLYDRPFKEVAAVLHQRGIEYYLRVDKEDHHPITARLGVGANLDEYFDLIHEEGGEKLYRLREEEASSLSRRGEMNHFR